jgi:hypothetical protein
MGGLYSHTNLCSCADCTSSTSADNPVNSRSFELLMFMFFSAKIGTAVNVIALWPR